MEQDAPRYHPIAIGLHWLLAACLLAQLFLGFWMEGVPKEPPGVRAGWFNLHKSTGLLLALLVVARLLWRLTHHPPDWPQTMPHWQQVAARHSHRLMYLCMLVLPLSGFLGSSFTPYPIRFFGLALPRLWEASAPLKELCTAAHVAASYALVALVGLHVGAALSHALRRDGVFGRMGWGRRMPQEETSLR